MEKNFIKDLFSQQRYNEVIEMLDSLYLDLYRTMLDYKQMDYSKNELTVDYLSSLVRISYPQFSDNITHLDILGSEPEVTYLDRINALLSTYMLMKDNYKNEAVEKAFSLDENEDNDDEDFITN